jgi:hypothetical protein
VRQPVRLYQFENADLSGRLKAVKDEHPNVMRFPDVSRPKQLSSVDIHEDVVDSKLNAWSTYIISTPSFPFIEFTTVTVGQYARSIGDAWKGSDDKYHCPDSTHPVKMLNAELK